MHAKLPIAVHVLLQQDDRVLLLRRANTDYEDGNFSIVAGHLDGNESVTRAAIREAREEVGVELPPGSLTVVGVMHRRSNDERVDFFLAARTWSGNPTNREPNKCSELRWCAIDSLPDNTVPYVRAALESIGPGVWFTEYGWEDASSI